MLTPKKKLTKKELKHDPLVDGIEKGKEFYEEYSKQIMGGLAGLILVIFLGWVWMDSMESARHEAMLAGTKATVTAAAGMDEGVLTQLEEVFTTYGSKPEVANANFQLGIARLEAGDLPGAEALFSEMAQSSDRQLAIAGALKLAYIAERNNDHLGAAELYLTVSAKATGATADWAKLQSAYAFQSAGNNVKANEIIAEMLDAEPKGKLAEEVRYLEGKLLEK